MMPIPQIFRYLYHRIKVTFILFSAMAIQPCAESTGISCRSLKFDALISTSTMPSLIAEDKIEDKSNNWTNYFNCYTFVKLKEGKTESELKHALNDLSQRQYNEIEDYKEFALVSQRTNRDHSPENL